MIEPYFTPEQHKVEALAAFTSTQTSNGGRWIGCEQAAALMAEATALLTQALTARHNSALLSLSTQQVLDRARAAKDAAAKLGNLCAIVNDRNVRLDKAALGEAAKYDDRRGLPVALDGMVEIAGNIAGILKDRWSRKVSEESGL